MKPKTAIVSAVTLGLLALALGRSSKGDARTPSAPAAPAVAVAEAITSTALSSPAIQAAKLAATKGYWSPPPAGAPRPVPPPGTYTPKGFHPQFRANIVRDFAAIIDARLGPDWSPDKRARIAQIQNAFWDEQGPNVDAFASHSITQPDFADKTKTSFDHQQASYAKLLTDDEYKTIFDLPKDASFYHAMFHSAEEQPGMPVNPYDNAASAGGYASLVPPGAGGAPTAPPPPDGVKDPGDRHAPPGSPPPVQNKAEGAAVNPAKR